MPSKFEFVEGHKLRRKVRAIICNEHDEYLLIQPYSYQADTWTLVGGGVEDGESYEEAILREIHEETGLQCIHSLEASNVEHWFCFSQKIKTQRQLDHDGQYAKIFWVRVSKSEKITLQSSEVRSFCWASADQVLLLIKIPEQRELFLKVSTELGHRLPRAA